MIKNPRGEVLPRVDSNQMYQYLLQYMRTSKRFLDLLSFGQTLKTKSHHNANFVVSSGTATRDDKVGIMTTLGFSVMWLMGYTFLYNSEKYDLVYYA